MTYFTYPYKKPDNIVVQVVTRCIVHNFTSLVLTNAVLEAIRFLNTTYCAFVQAAFNKLRHTVHWTFQNGFAELSSVVIFCSKPMDA